MAPELLRLLLLLRMIAFLAFLYLVFGAVVERLVRDRESKLRGFARLICSPLTAPVGKLMGKEAPYPRLLRYTLAVFGVIWLALFITSEFALTR